MHPVMSMKNWSHHLHDGILSMGHHIDEHLHSRHFWTGVGVALLIAALVTLLLFAIKYAPAEMPFDYPHGVPYTPYAL